MDLIFPPLIRGGLIEAFLKSRSQSRLKYFRVRTAGPGTGARPDAESPCALAQRRWLPRCLRYHPPRPWPSDHLSILIDDLATANRRPRPAGHFPAGVNGPFRVGQLILVANRAL